MAALFQQFNPFQGVGSNQYGFSSSIVAKGSLLAFNYPISYAKEQPYYIHDPYPLVIVTDIWPHYLRGVNLHYLSFPYIRHLLQPNCGNTGFSYSNIRADKYIASAFRMYYREGMHKPKKLDCAYILDLLGTVRRFSNTEIERIRDEVRKQIQQRLQLKAEQLTAQDRYRLGQKAEQVRNVIQGGQERGLTYPQEFNVGLRPANLQVPPGGPESTEMPLPG